MRGRICAAIVALVVSTGACGDDDRAPPADAGTDAPPPPEDGMVVPDGSVPPPPFPVGPMCNEAFCWLDEHRVPEALFTVWGSSPTDVWALGADGVALHFDGSTWMRVDAGVDVDLHDVSGSGPDDVWAIGDVRDQVDDATVIHWDGARWERVAVDAGACSGAGAVSVLGRGSVWIGCEDVRHWDGSTWAVRALDTAYTDVYAIAAISDDEVFFRSERWSPSPRVHKIVHSRSATDQPVIWQGEEPVSALAARATNDVWIAGRDSLARSWDGTTWTEHRAELSSDFNALWTDGEQLLGTMRHGTVRWTGTEWEDLDGPWDARDLWVGADDVLWIVGHDILARRIAGVWQASSANPHPGGIELTVLGERDFLLGSRGGHKHFDGTSWTEFELPGRVTPTAFYFASASQAFACVGSASVFKWDGTAWALATSLVDAAGSTWTHGLAVSGSSASDVWIFGHVGKGVASVSHYDGAVWTPAAVPAIDAALSAAIYVASPTEAWIAHGMSILKWDGSAWSIAHSAATELLDIAGSSESDVWAVGRDGLAVHWDGTSWSETTTGVAITLTQVASAGPTRAWAAGGRGGTILEWNGTAWTPKVGLSRESISVLTYADKLWGMTSGGGIFYAR